MCERWPTVLLALAYNVIPELREQRERYYNFWNFIGAAAILGWVIVLILYRVRPLRQRVLGGLFGVALTLGFVFGLVVWLGLADYSWGDMGVSSRWLGELTTCIFGCVGWAVVAGWLPLSRR